MSHSEFRPVRWRIQRADERVATLPRHAWASRQVTLSVAFLLAGALPARALDPSRTLTDSWRIRPEPFGLEAMEVSRGFETAGGRRLSGTRTAGRSRSGDLGRQRWLMILEATTEGNLVGFAIGNAAIVKNWIPKPGRRRCIRLLRGAAAVMPTLRAASGSRGTSLRSLPCSIPKRNRFRRTTAQGLSE